MLCNKERYTDVYEAQTQKVGYWVKGLMSRGGITLFVLNIGKTGIGSLKGT